MPPLCIGMLHTYSIDETRIHTEPSGHSRLHVCSEEASFLRSPTPSEYPEAIRTSPAWILDSVLAEGFFPRFMARTLFLATSKRTVTVVDETWGALASLVASAP